MNKRIKKKVDKGRPVNIKSYHTREQVVYRVNNYFRKMGTSWKYYGWTTGRMSIGHNVQELPREDHNLSQ